MPALVLYSSSGLLDIELPNSDEQVTTPVFGAQLDLVDLIDIAGRLTRLAQLLDGLRRRQCLQLADIKRALNWGSEIGICPPSPATRFRSRGRLPAKRRPMSDEEFQALMRHSAPAYRRFLIFLKLTGCRPGEASARPGEPPPEAWAASSARGITAQPEKASAAIQAAP